MFSGSFSAASSYDIRTLLFRCGIGQTVVDDAVPSSGIPFAYSFSFRSLQLVSCVDIEVEFFAFEVAESVAIDHFPDFLIDSSEFRIRFVVLPDLMVDCDR